MWVKRINCTEIGWQELPKQPELYKVGPKFNMNQYNFKKIQDMETFLVVQWLRLHASTTGDAHLILGRGTKIPHVPSPQNYKICFT